MWRCKGLTIYKYSYCDVSRLSRVFWMALAKARWVHKPNSPVLCASSRRGYKNQGEKSRTVFFKFRTMLVLATHRPSEAWKVSYCVLGVIVENCPLAPYFPRVQHLGLERSALCRRICCVPLGISGSLIALLLYCALLIFSVCGKTQ